MRAYLPFYPINPVQQHLHPCLPMRRVKKTPLAEMFAIDRYRFPHVRTDMEKQNLIYNRHDMTLREPIERADKERVLESIFTLPCMEGVLSILNLPY